MKITDFKNEDAIELIADLIEPTANIFSDKDIQKAIGAGKSKLIVAKMALKTHKDDIMTILATLNGQDVKDYNCNPISVLKDLLAILDDAELMDFFSEQQAIMNTGGAPLSVVENTEDAGL